jgi:hypothetical protein
LALVDPRRHLTWSLGSFGSVQRSAFARHFDLSARGELPHFHLVEKDALDLARLYFGDACCHRINDGVVPLRARHDSDEPGGIWRSQYGQESTGDFSNYRAIKIHTKLPDADPMKLRSSSLDTWGRIGARSATCADRHMNSTLCLEMLSSVPPQSSLRVAAPRLSRKPVHSTIESLRSFHLAFIDEFAPHLEEI